MLAELKELYDLYWEEISNIKSNESDKEIRDYKLMDVYSDFMAALYGIISKYDKEEE